MKQFRVYQRWDDAIEAVKVGWSWPGFFFPFFWSMAKKLWAQAIFMFLGYFFIAWLCIFFVPFNFTMVETVFWVGSMLLFGAQGNKWREQGLIYKGYRLCAERFALDAASAVNATIQGIPSE